MPTRNGNRRTPFEVVDVGEAKTSTHVVLRHLVQRARQGDFVGVVALLAKADGGYIAVMTPMAPDAVVGQLEFLKQMIIDDSVEDIEHDDD
jgi:hypothetical protein